MLLRRDFEEATMETCTYDMRKRDAPRDIVPAVERAVPGVEVLAVELLSPSRFCVYVDHPEGVDHALCARVTEILPTTAGSYTIDVSSPGPRPAGAPARALSPGRRGTDVQIRPPPRSPARTAFAARSSPPRPERRIAVGETELDIPYEEIVRGNLIDEG